MAQANLAHGPNLGPGPQFKKPCYIPLDKLYSIDEPIKYITITLFIINCMNNLI